MLPTPTPAVWPLSRIKPGRNLSRQTISDDTIRELWDSIKANGQLNPLLVIDRPDDNLIAGFRRFHALRHGGAQEAKVSVYPAGITLVQVMVLNGVENLQHEGLKDADVYGICKGILAADPSMKKQDLAQAFGKSAGWMTQALCPDDLIPEAREAFLAGKFGFSIAYSISRADDQAAALAKRLRGATRKELDAANGSILTVELSLEGGYSFRVAGPGLTFDLAVKQARAAIREMEAASAAGHTVATLPTWLQNRPAKKPRKGKANGQAD